MRKEIFTKVMAFFALLALVFNFAGCLRNEDDKSGTTYDSKELINTDSKNTLSTESDPELTSAAIYDTTPDSQAEASTEQDTEPAAKPVSVPAGEYTPKVFMYHLILDEVYSYENLFVRPSEFDAQLTMIDERGMEYMFADDWHRTAVPSVIITLDDGYVDNYTEMFPILKAHGARATIFVVTDLIGTSGYLTEEQIREMSDSGLVSIQCHTAHHRDLSYQSEEALREDFSSSVSRLESITGKPVTALAYPAGSYNDTVLSVASEFFTYAYTTKSPFNITDYTDLTIPRYAVPRGCGYYESFLG